MFRKAFVQVDMSTILDVRHNHMVHSLAFSPDGGIIAISSGDGILQFATLNGHKTQVDAAFGGPVRTVAFSSSGSWFATASGDHAVRIWDVASMTELLLLNGNLARVNKVSFSPDGSYVASASTDGTVRLWDSSTGEPFLMWDKDDVDHACISLAFSSNGTHLFVGTDQGTIYLVDSTTGADTTFFVDEYRGPISTVDVSYNGSCIAASHPRAVLLWKSFTPGTPPIMLEGHTETVYCVTFTPNGSRLVSGSFDNTVRVWDVKTCDVICVLQDHTADIMSIAVSPSESYIVSGDESGVIRLWDTAIADAHIEMEFELPSGISSEVSLLAGKVDDELDTYSETELSNNRATHRLTQRSTIDNREILPASVSTELNNFMIPRILPLDNTDCVCSEERCARGTGLRQCMHLVLDTIRKYMRPRRMQARRSVTSGLSQEHKVQALDQPRVSGSSSGELEGKHVEMRTPSFVCENASYGRARTLIGAVVVDREMHTSRWCCTGSH
ncbi:hypothetical protein CERSUDRAFT_115389 [Gelatoporia subvermispora B]|uniref:Uncharacterized protein n=1 Tax=Ceriporiopsis subvermispora (strain B) TaxID=914234 RepID=M2RC72_CERS8|nr:hypothetical protein CERSUDRAFT_115389 [Gelatoporia subvermispora B]